MNKLYSLFGGLVLGAAALLGSAQGASAAPEPVAIQAAQPENAAARIFGPYRYRYQAEYVADYWRSCGYCAVVFYYNGYWYVRVW
jgi:hypothetical protein